MWLAVSQNNNALTHTQTHTERRMNCIYRNYFISIISTRALSSLRNVFFSPFLTKTAINIEKAAVTVIITWNVGRKLHRKNVNLVEIEREFPIGIAKKEKLANSDRKENNKRMGNEMEATWKRLRMHQNRVNIHICIRKSDSLVNACRLVVVYWRLRRRNRQTTHNKGGERLVTRYTTHTPCAYHREEYEKRRERKVHSIERRWTQRKRNWLSTHRHTGYKRNGYKLFSNFLSDFYFFFRINQMVHGINRFVYMWTWNVRYTNLINGSLCRIYMRIYSPQIYTHSLIHTHARTRIRNLSHVIFQRIHYLFLRINLPVIEYFLFLTVLRFEFRQGKNTLRFLSVYQSFQKEIFYIN